MKLIAKTIKGKEFMYSKRDCGFVSDRSAYKICDILNKAKYKCKDDECWYVYEYDWMMENYCFSKFTIRNGNVSRKYL